jgi:6-phospho-3-hexuloisomerase
MISTVIESAVREDAVYPVVGNTVSHAVDLILTENRHVLGQVSAAVFERFVSLLTDVDRTFVVGEGRSGLAVRMFAMRLMHLGYQVYVVGETTTPALRRDDLLIACSGSGTTSTVLAMTTTARLVGGRIAAVTTVPESSLGQVADVVITIPAAAKQDHSQQYSEQFAGSLFEQAALLLFDAIIHALTHSLGKDAETLWSMHANLE